MRAIRHSGWQKHRSWPPRDRATSADRVGGLFLDSKDFVYGADQPRRIFLDVPHAVATNANQTQRHIQSMPSRRIILQFAWRRTVFCIISSITVGTTHAQIDPEPRQL